MTSWPELPLAEWHATYATLHRWLQIVGKTRLALAPFQNHWWHVTLYLTARGLTTAPMRVERGFLEIEFDFIRHQVALRTSRHEEQTLALRPRSVADFYDEYRTVLRRLDVTPRIHPVPQELADAVPFDRDDAHAAYDAAAAERCWQVLLRADGVFREFRAAYLGKCSPSHFWWGAFDLACTRFSGRPAPMHPGGVPNLADAVVREAYSHECMSVGWWPGNLEGPISEPAFYAYAYPEPAGFAQAAVPPAAAFYHDVLKEWVLPYEAVRAARDPANEVRAFLHGAYQAAAELGAWPPDLERPATAR